MRNAYLPKRWQDRTWTPFNDITLIDVGVVFFDKSCGYAGIITSRETINGAIWYNILWHKSSDSMIPDRKTAHMIMRESYDWIDPYEDGNEDM